jgi:hypothetical protein
MAKGGEAEGAFSLLEEVAERRMKTDISSALFPNFPAAIRRQKALICCKGGLKKLSGYT